MVCAGSWRVRGREGSSAPRLVLVLVVLISLEPLSRLASTKHSCTSTRPDSPQPAHRTHHHHRPPSPRTRHARPQPPPPRRPLGPRVRPRTRSGQPPARRPVRSPSSPSLCGLWCAGAALPGRRRAGRRTIERRGGGRLGAQREACAARRRTAPRCRTSGAERASPPPSSPTPHRARRRALLAAPQPSPLRTHTDAPPSFLFNSGNTVVVSVVTDAAGVALDTTILSTLTTATPDALDTATDAAATATAIETTATTTLPTTTAAAAAETTTEPNNLGQPAQGASSFSRALLFLESAQTESSRALTCEYDACAQSSRPPRAAPRPGAPSRRVRPSPSSSLLLAPRAAADALLSRNSYIHPKWRDRDLVCDDAGDADPAGDEQRPDCWRRKLCVRSSSLPPLLRRTLSMIPPLLDDVSTRRALLETVLRLDEPR